MEVVSMRERPPSTMRPSRPALEKHRGMPLARLFEARKEAQSWRLRGALSRETMGPPDASR
jgi:hypothetical protein